MIKNFCYGVLEAFSQIKACCKHEKKINLVHNQVTLPENTVLPKVSFSRKAIYI